MFKSGNSFKTTFCTCARLRINTRECTNTCAFPTVQFEACGCSSSIDDDGEQRQAQ